MNRLYQVLSGINETIVRVTDPQRLMEEVCRIYTEVGLFRMGASFRYRSESEFPELVAYAGVVDDYFSEIRVNLSIDKLSQGTIGTAIRTGRYDICNGMALDPRMEPWRKPALDRGYRATASFPISLRGKVYGVIVLFASEPDYLQEDELKLLVSVSENVSFAIESIHKENLRK